MQSLLENGCCRKRKENIMKNSTPKTPYIISSIVILISVWEYFYIIKRTELFNSFDAEIPFLSAFVINNKWITIFIGVLAFIFALLYFFKKIKPLKVKKYCRLLLLIEIIYAMMIYIGVELPIFDCWNLV